MNICTSLLWIHGICHSNIACEQTYVEGSLDCAADWARNRVCKTLFSLLDQVSWCFAYHVFPVVAQIQKMTLWLMEIIIGKEKARSKYANVNFDSLSNLDLCASLSDCRTSLFNLGSDEVLIILISTLGLLGFIICLIMVCKNDEEFFIN